MPDWINVPDNIEEYQGFVYYIYNLVEDKYYIGKKTFWSKRTLPPLKGRTKEEKARRAKLKGQKRHIVFESDWKDYWGSSNNLLDDIERLGVNSFKREILKCYKDKWDCAYYELIEQIEQKVLFDDKSYNEIVNIRLRKRKGKKNEK